MLKKLIERIKNHPALNKKLFWFDSISDEFLGKIYSSSHCLIAASKGEGFGLPIIEAMKYDLPIIAHDIPVFREIAGKKATYFVGTTANALAIHVQEIVSLNKKSLKTKHQQVSWLTWFESAQSVKKLLTNKSTLTVENYDNENIISEKKEKKEKNIKKLYKYKKSLKNVNNKISLISTENYKLKIAHESSLIKNLQLDSQIKNLQLEAIINIKNQKDKELESIDNSQQMIKEIKCKNVELSRLSSTVLEREQELDFLKRHIEEKNIALLQQDVFYVELSRISSTILEREQELDFLKRHIEEKNIALLQQDVFLEEQQKYIVHVSTEKSKVDQDIEKLRALLSSQQEQINSMLTSTSWRVTYPLRLFSRCLRWIVRLPIRLVRVIVRSILKALILTILEINPLRVFLSRKLKSYPSLYAHLKRFSINRSILHLNQARSIKSTTVSSNFTQPLTPHAHKIYIALKNAKNDNKE